jgi:mannan endo-1,4-beta-mannosidase
MVMS